MNQLIEMIENALEKKGLSAAAASRQAVGNSSFIKNLKLYKKPSFDKLQSLCDVLGIEIHFGQTTNHQQNNTAPFIPILGLAACGDDGWAKMGTNVMRARLPDRSMSLNTFAVIAKGESMQPFGIFSGAICYCDPDVALEIGHLAFIERKMSDKESSYALKRINMITANNTIEIIGYHPLKNNAQEQYSETIFHNEILKIAPVCWVNTNPVL